MPWPGAARIPVGAILLQLEPAAHYSEVLERLELGVGGGNGGETDGA